jgi:hypothetical protein
MRGAVIPGGRPGDGRAHAAGLQMRSPVGSPSPAAPSSVPAQAVATLGGPSANIQGGSTSLPPAVQVAGRSPSAGTLPGISVPVAAGSALLLILLALTGVLGFGLLSAEGLAPWEPRRRWRSSWIHHHPWNWHG